MNPASPDPVKGTKVESRRAAPVARPRIRLINTALRSGDAEEALMPEAACGCDSDNHICVVGDITVKVCGVYG
jgi:hypothetical protein